MITANEIKQLTAKRWRVHHGQEQTEQTREIIAAMKKAGRYTSKEIALQMGLDRRLVHAVAYRLGLKGRARKLGRSGGSPRNNGSQVLWEFLR